MKRIASTLAFAVILLMLTACGAANGRIVIFESMRGTGCEIGFSEWSEHNKCALSLNKHDVLQVEVVCKSGSVDLDIRSKNGAKAYTGNSLDTGIFTVQVPEAGEYVIAVKGEDANGSIHINSLASIKSERECVK